MEQKQHFFYEIAKTTKKKREEKKMFITVITLSFRTLKIIIILVSETLATEINPFVPHVRKPRGNIGTNNNFLFSP